MFKNQKRKIWKKLLFATGIFLLIFTFAPDSFTTSFDSITAFANGGNVQTAVSQTDNSQLTRFSTALLGISNAVNKLIWPILIMIGGLLDNSILFGAGMEDRMREIWIPIRNIMNILFVVALVGIALYNVLGIGEENGEYSIKAILPKIVIGIIAVNFSFVGVKLVLDTVNVLTTSVFSLPDQVGEEMARITVATDDKTIDRFCKVLQGAPIDQVVTDEELIARTQQKSCKIAADNIGISTVGSCTEIEQAAADAGRSSGYQEALNRLQQGEICQGGELTETGRVFLQRFSSRNVAVAMALSLGKILYYQDVDFNIQNIEDLFISTVFSALMYIAYLASFLALFIILLARLVVMWLAIVLSPIIMLAMAVPALESKLPGFDKIKEEFVKNAVVPLAVSIPLTVGWIMLKSMQSVNNLSPDSLFIDRRVFEGASNGIPVVGLNTLQDLVVAIGTLAVIWLGVFAAAEASVARDITNSIKGGLEGLGKFVAGIPFKHIKAVPIINPQTGEKMGDYSAAQVTQALKNLNSTGDVNKLWDDIRGGKSATTQDIIAANTDADLVSTLKDPVILNNLNNQDNHRNLKLKLETPEGQEILTKISTKDPNLAAQLKRYADAPPDKLAEEAEKLKKALERTQPPEYQRKTSTLDTAPSVQDQSKDVVSPDKPIEYKDVSGNKQVINANAQQATTLNANFSALKEKAAEGNGAEVITQLANLNASLGTMGVEFDNVQDFTNFMESTIGQPEFEKITKTLSSLPDTDFPEILSDTSKGDGAARAFVKATGKTVGQQTQ